jgi:hypothetical protein
VGSGGRSITRERWCTVNSHQKQESDPAEAASGGHLDEGDVKTE